MLTEAERLLIEQAVDGELTASESSDFRALVARSADALALYHALNQQSRRLAALPRQDAPPQLADKVRTGLAAHSQTVVPVPVRVVVAPIHHAADRRLTWLAMAASLLAVGIGAALVPYLNEAPVEVVQAPGVPFPTDWAGPVEPRVEVEAAPEPRLAIPLVPAPEQVASLEAAPEPRLSVDAALVGGVLLEPLPKFATTTARPPALFAVSELDQPEVQARLKAELTHGPAVRVDLFARDLVRGYEQFGSAAASVGMSVSTDAILADRLRRRQPTGWAIYTESLTANDFCRLVSTLAAQARENPDSFMLLTLHAYAAGAGDSREIRELVGVERPAWKRNRLAAKPTVARPTTIPALAVPVFSSGSRPNPFASAEVKEYWQATATQPPVTCPVLFICRPQ